MGISAKGTRNTTLPGKKITRRVIIINNRMIRIIKNVLGVELSTSNLK
jgi:hypothetical protein